MSPYVWLTLGFSVLLLSCSPKAEPPSHPAIQTAVPNVTDESNRFPKAKLIGTKVVNTSLLGKAFMPGGTIAHYQKGRAEYDMFIAKLPTAMDAAILLPDWRKALQGAKLIPSFGGYFGMDEGRPVFVFAKEAWIAGVAGLPEKDADTQARVLAGALR